MASRAEVDRLEKKVVARYHMAIYRYVDDVSTEQRTSWFYYGWKRFVEKYIYLEKYTGGEE